MVSFLHNGGEITKDEAQLQNQKHKVQSNFFKIRNFFFKFQATDH